MTDFITMTAAQADSVRGETVPGHSLEPAVLADGSTYVLPATVLTDPYHAAKRDVLAAFTVRAVDPSEFPQPPAP